MTIADFHSLVRAEINRGAIYDSLIVSKTKQAVKWFEAAHTFDYMDRYVELTINPDSTNPRTISLPSEFKKIDLFRLIVTEGDIRVLPRVNPADVKKRETGKYPTGYWVSQKRYLWLDNIPAETTNAEIFYKAFTEVPNDTAETLPVLELYEYVLLYRVLLSLAPNTEASSKKIQGWGILLKDGMQIAVSENLENQDSGIDANMSYSGNRVGNS